MEKMLSPRNISMHWPAIKKHITGHPSPESTEKEIHFKSGYYWAAIVTCALCIVLLLVVSVQMVRG